MTASPERKIALLYPGYRPPATVPTPRLAALRHSAMLRQVADTGVIVSAHPDAILRLGTKDVLFRRCGRV